VANKKNLALILLIFLIILSAFFVSIFKQKNMNKGKACFKANCFDVDLAVSLREKEKGLMFKDILDINKGMLFVYDDEGAYSFWMKNTKIPLDIIWINSKSEVVYINANTQPCDEVNCPAINPGNNAKYVLEINAGMADNIGLKINDKLDLSF